MVDIHSHILYGLDDGPKDRDTSIEMLRLAAAQGTTAIVATPHSNQRYRFQPDEIARQLEDLSQIESLPKIYTGCDFHLSFDNIQDCLKYPLKYVINGKQYLLVEFADFSIPPSTATIFKELIVAGMTPIITHPERNPILARSFELLSDWIATGCRVQITAQSLDGSFGKLAEKSAHSLIKNGLAHFIASDAHDLKHRPPGMRSAFDQIQELYGADLAQRLFVENPSAVLTGSDVPAYAPGVKETRRWFKLW